MFRSNPLLVTELIRYIQEPPTQLYESKIGDRQHLKLDPSLLESMVQLMLDNLFVDSSQTSDTNLLCFNTLSAYSLLLNPGQQSKLSPLQQRQNNITSKEQLNSHISISIFNSLIKSVEAQSYLRFIYRNIFSKINLVQLNAFINEKEALHKHRMGGG
jgi:hypothetical protein